MDNQIKYAFDAVQTPDRLKRMTKAALRKKTFDYGRNVLQLRKHRARLAGAVLSLVLVIGGSSIWCLPTTRIAVDINPSIEIHVNTFDRVITVEGKNADGVALVRELNVNGMSYADALQRILLSNGLEQYLDEEHDISITVAGGGTEAHANEMLDNVLCRAFNIAGKENVHYYQVDWDTVNAARELNLSIPQYLAWQQMLNINPNTTPEDIRNMTLTQIRVLSQVKIVENPCHE